MAAHWEQLGWKPYVQTFTHRSLSQGAFHRSSFPFNAVVPWCKIQLTRIQTNKLPSTLSPIYQQIIGSDIAPARHIPEKASVEPSAAQATLSSVAAVSHASIEDFKDALTWKANPSAPKVRHQNEILQYSVFPSSTTVLHTKNDVCMCALHETCYYCSYPWRDKNKNHGQMMWNVFHDFPSWYRLRNVSQGFNDSPDDSFIEGG